jgi:hypothetical protein
MVDGLIFVWDRDKIAAKLDLPVDHVPDRPQDAEGLVHFIPMGRDRVRAFCETTAVDAAGVFWEWEGEAPVVTCPVCRPHVAVRRKP